MEPVTGIAIALLVALLAANAVGTALVLRDRYAERQQKVFQLLALWLVPILGAVFVLSLYRTPEKAGGTYREAGNAGVDPDSLSRTEHGPHHD